MRLNRDVGKWWVREDGGFPFFLTSATLAYTIFTALVCVGSMSALFSLAFLPVALLSGAALWAMGWGLRKVRKKTAGDDRWPPVKVLHEATSFFAGMTELFGAGDHDFSTGGLMGFPLAFTLLALFLSPLVAWGTPLALHAYAGSSAAANNALIENTYRTAFQGFSSWDFALPLLNLDADQLWQALQDALQWPELSWGPERLMQNAEAMLTLNALVGVLKSLLSAASAVLAFMKLVAPNIPTSKIAGDDDWAEEGVAKVQAIIAGDEVLAKEGVVKVRAIANVEALPGQTVKVSTGIAWLTARTARIEVSSAQGVV